MALIPNLTKAGVAMAALAFLSFQGFPSVAQQVPAPARAAPQVELTLPQARAVAVDALRKRQPRLAYSIAKGLLKADPKSSFAHFTLANAQGLLGQATPARKSAARAYRYADSKLHRFEAAELAARLSYAEDRPTMTQLWLRRAVQNAPNKQVEEQLGRDFGAVRAQNPFSFSIRGGVRPSSNVNGGSSEAVQIIDGLPFTGVLSGAAQALAGTVGTFDASARYRLRGTKRSRTEISARVFTKRVALTNGAKAQAPDARGSDFSSTFAEVQVLHDFAVGQTGNSARLGAGLGQFWYGGDKSYAFLNLSAGHSWKVSAQTTLALDASVEQRASDRSAMQDSTSFALVGSLRHARENGDQLSFALNLRKTDSDARNSRSTSATVSANYAWAKQMGPAKISAGVVAGYSDYGDYVALFEVPGGRQDRSIYANLNFFFPDIDYAGFAPTLRVTAGRKLSNVSRFESEQFSVSLGIQSKF